MWQGLHAACIIAMTWANPSTSSPGSNTPRQMPRHSRNSSGSYARQKSGPMWSERSISVSLAKGHEIYCTNPRSGQPIGKTRRMASVLAAVLPELSPCLAEPTTDLLIENLPLASKPPASSSEIPEAVPASSQERLVPGLTGATCRLFVVPVQDRLHSQGNRRYAPP